MGGTSNPWSELYLVSIGMDNTCNLYYHVICNNFVGRCVYLIMHVHCNVKTQVSFNLKRAKMIHCNMTEE